MSENLEAIIREAKAVALEEAVAALEEQDSITRKYPISWLWKRAVAARAAANPTQE